MQVKRDDNHRYTIDGKPVPGVTEVLKAAGFIDDRWFNPEATQRGTIVHRMCELWDKEIPMPGALRFPELGGYLEAWKRFRRETGFVPTEVEAIIGHPTLMYAGTLDRLGDLDAERVLVDIKTGSPAPWHGVQTKAYAEPVSPLMPRFGVYLSDDGKYKVHQYMLWDDWDAFVAALSCWKWKERHGLND